MIGVTFRWQTRVWKTEQLFHRDRMTMSRDVVYARIHGKYGGQGGRQKYKARPRRSQNRKVGETVYEIHVGSLSCLASLMSERCVLVASDPRRQMCSPGQ